MANRTLVFFSQVKKGRSLVFEQFATGQSNADGVATVVVPPTRREASMRVEFAGDTSFLASSAQISGR